jgi:hypothetical protein
MTAEEQRALLAVALPAAFADGDKSEAEREEVKRIATTGRRGRRAEHSGADAGRAAQAPGRA